MQDEKASMKSKVAGVGFEDTGEEIIIRFDTEERLDAHELSLVWDEFMFWTKSISCGRKSNPWPASPQIFPATPGGLIWHPVGCPARN
jgi:hypothetical protein